MRRKGLAPRREEGRGKIKENIDKQNAASRTQMFGPGRAVWHRKGLAPRREEGREQIKERRESREKRK